MYKRQCGVRIYTRPYVGGVFVDILMALLTSISVLLVLTVFSPPLPFYDPLCATGRHDPTPLIPALLFYWLRRWLRNQIVSDEEDSEDDD